MNPDKEFRIAWFLTEAEKLLGDDMNCFTDVLQAIRRLQKESVSSRADAINEARAAVQKAVADYGSLSLDDLQGKYGTVRLSEIILALLPPSSPAPTEEGQKETEEMEVK